MPHVVVTDLRYTPSSLHNNVDVLSAATFGRGVMSISNFLATFLQPAAPSSPVLAGAPLGGAPSAANGPGVLNVTGDDTNNNIRLVLDASNPDVLDVFIDNTTGEPDFSIDAAAVQGVIVTGGVGNDTLTIDDANGIVSFPGGITFESGSCAATFVRKLTRRPFPPESCRRFATACRQSPISAQSWQRSASWPSRFPDWARASPTPCPWETAQVRSGA